MNVIISPKPLVIAVPLREDLANIAGTAIETTIRTLSDFKSEGLIEIKGTAIQVMKLDKLKAMRN